MGAKGEKASGPGVVKQTPMMRQYLEVKEAYQDCILFFRLGDFYEMFFEDAEVASGILDIALTSRAKGKDAYPMCGVPYFSAGSYIARLVEAGHKVAVCDQVEDARQAKGIVRRAVTRVISPGMITDPEDLDARQSNYLGSVVPAGEGGEGGGGFGFAFLDVSTADFRHTWVDDAESLLDELARVQPRELLLPAATAGAALHRALQQRFKRMFVRFVEPEAHPAEDLSAPLRALLEEAAASGGAGPGIEAASRLLAYAEASLPGSLDHVRRLTAYQVADHAVIDDASRTNLELVQTLMEGRRQGALLGFLDRTRTPMGARLLQQWLLYPLIDPDQINRRLDAVAQLVEDRVLCGDLRERLGAIRDIERLLAKVAVGRAGPRDLGALRDSFAQLPAWAGLIGGAEGAALRTLAGAIDLLADLHTDLDAALVDEPPAELAEGGAVRPGYHPELDRLVALATNGRDFIAALERQERDRTGIGSLKIRYNRVFGYYIEVTKPNLHLVPDDYRRKQTTANAERYETDELKRQEEAILQAQDERAKLEQTIVAGLQERVRCQAERILQAARQVATTDVVAAFAELASAHDYCRPVVDTSEEITIEDGRHPVVEHSLAGERFVPNDVHLACGKDQILLITGPNMAGKSTVIRQVALIAVMAQMGSFVPARKARIGVVDRVFTRLGAADNLARGQSTFMVEMVETANILRHATRRSLLVLDEIGRGTSTFDGLSIAWATAEYIHDRIGARTLFATHYHQLTDLTRTQDRVVNYTISVKEWKDQIVFLRRLVRGVCSRSYGIQVGRLAGLPEEVVGRAREILANLEGQEYDEIGAPRLSRTGGETGPRTGQLQLFAVPARSHLEQELEELDLDTLAPLEALQLLHRWKEGL